MTKQNFDPKELKNSNRIFKSATPKYTADWYIKWIASAFILTAMAIRGTESLVIWDLSLSFIGVSLWLIVSILWNDRALILLNGIGIVFLLRTLVSLWN
jgi:hypothetical protein